MSRSLLARVGVTTLSVVSLLTVGCSQESPSSPSVAAGGVGDLAARPEKPAGRYELIFLDGFSSFPQPVVSPVPVNTIFVVGARVFDRASGLRVTDGTVIFEVLLSARGLRASRPRARPRTEAGPGGRLWRDGQSARSVARSWTCSNPITIGFRLRYAVGRLPTATTDRTISNGSRTDATGQLISRRLLV